MQDFFKFPGTPYLQLLGLQRSRDDKLMSPDEVAFFLSSRITVEEKLDGANLGISVGSSGELRAQNRGNYITRDAGGQFKQLWRWIDARKDELTDKLGDNLILFGEWCYAEHSVSYYELPDWLIAFDIFDQIEGRFYSVERRNALLSEIGIEVVAALGIGKFEMGALKEFLGRGSRYGASYPEGIYLRKDRGDWLQARAKLVRLGFTQSISKHWSSRNFKVNRISFG